MTVDIPLPDRVPDLPTWGWVVAGTVAWYVGVSLVYRFSGYGRKVYDEWAKHEAEIAERNKYRGSSEPRTAPPPELAVFGRILITPLEWLVMWPVVLAVGTALYGPVLAVRWLAVGKAPPPPAAEEKKV